MNAIRRVRVGLTLWTWATRWNEVDVQRLLWVSGGALERMRLGESDARALSVAGRPMTMA